MRLFLPCFFCIMFFGPACRQLPASGSPTTFTNPLIRGSDPWVIRKDGFYYYTQTYGNRIELTKTTSMSSLGKATPVKVFTPPPNALNSHHLWAPELHFIRNKWYIYYTAGAGPDSTQRLWVLENENPDPTKGTWTDKGRIFSRGKDIWAIDGSYFSHKGKDYFVWSGRPVIGVQNQNIYISSMINPWTLDTVAFQISAPELPWERHGGPVNEGPQILKNKRGQLFLVYSASGCWTNKYCLGMLSLLNDTDPLRADNWIKSPSPVFSTNTDSTVYGPGHNAFFKSPNGKEDWIIYHANDLATGGCDGKRTIRMQQFTWGKKGLPNFGLPFKPDTAIIGPAGD